MSLAFLLYSAVFSVEKEKWEESRKVVGYFARPFLAENRYKDQDGSIHIEKGGKILELIKLDYKIYCCS